MGVPLFSVCKSCTSMPSHVVRTESRTFPYNVKYHMDISSYCSLKYLRDFTEFSQLYTSVQWVLCYRLVHFLHQMSRFISVTFKINIGTCANKVQVLQYSAVSLETCLPFCSSRDQTLLCSKPNVGLLGKPAIEQALQDRRWAGSGLVPFCGIQLLM